ncbi:outer membrane protein assembly factor BamB family protein [Rugosimonospora africana]|nr:PQQ-binding-like beta-propeller repeat protein [Rugosimonospora africana]
MADDVIIDLDWEPPAPAAGRQAARRPVHRLLVVAIAVLCMAVLGGVEPAPPRIAAVFAVPIDERPAIALTTDTIVVAEAADTSGGRTPRGVVTAYALPSGALRWRSLLPNGVRDLTALPGAGVVLVTSESDGDDAMTVLDVHDGRTLWASGSTVVLDAPPGSTEGLLFDGGSGGTATVRWADLRTGRAVWTRSWSTSADIQFSTNIWPPESTRLLMPAADGTVDLVEERTGKVLASGRLGDTAAPPRHDGQPEGADPTAPPGSAGTSPTESVVAGDRIVVLRPSPLGQPGRLAAFDASTFAPQWTADARPGYLDGACRPMLCLSGDQLTVMDPETGPLWRSGHWQAAARLDDAHLLTFSADNDSAMVDTRTGRVVADLSDWRPVFDRDTGQLRLLLSTTLRPYGGFWLAELGSAGVRPLGFVPAAIFGDCQTAGDLLACDTQRGIVQVWRYRD